MVAMRRPLTARKSRGPSMWKNSNIKKNGQEEVVFCHLCLDGPMENDAVLTEHLDEFHSGAYEDRIERVKKRGTFAQAMDPMKTCFQCYRVVESFIALQVSLALTLSSFTAHVRG